MSVNERIREVMFFYRKNATDLAKDLGITKATIGRTLKGETLPSSKFLIPLGEKLGISIDWLLFGEGDMMRGASQRVVSDEGGEPRKKATELETQQIKSLEAQVKLLKQTIKDKDEIIGLLKENKHK